MESVTYKNNKPILLFFSFLLISIAMFSFVSSATLSISEANIRSNYFNFDKAWVLSFVSDDYTTDSLTAYLTPKSLEDVSGTESKQSLEIDVDTRPNYCTYSFKTNSFKYEDVYTIEPIHISKWVWTESDLNDFKRMVESRCADFSKPDYKADLVEFSDGTWTVGEYVRGKNEWLFEYHAYCVQLNEKIGTIAQPIDKRIVAESDWSVRAVGKNAETETISNSEAGSGRNTKIGDNVYVQWQGNLGTGEDCPDVSNLIGVHDNSFNDGWIFGSRNNYNTYNSYLTNGLKSDIESYAESSNPTNYANILRSNANSIIRDVTDEKEDFTYSVLDSSVSSGKVKIDLGRQIVFPLFRLIIDADYLEINIPTGDPEIVSVTNVEFTEGLSGQMRAVVKNKGSSKGGFTARVINCDSGFSSSTSPIGINLDPQQTSELSFNIIGSTTSGQASISGRCTLELKESTSGEIATKSFSVEMEQIQQCAPLSKACSFDKGKEVIKQCNSAGTAYEIIESCGDNEECRLTPSGAECVVKGSGDVGICSNCDEYAWSYLIGWAWKDKRCDPASPSLIKLSLGHSPLTCIFSFIKIAISLIIILSGSLFSYGLLDNLFEGRIDRTPRKIISLIVGVGLSILTSFLVYNVLSLIF